MAQVYGSLQGPPIPASVDRENLPLGRQRLRVVKMQKEGISKNKQSINVNYLVASADKAVRGTAFFRYNFRHIAFKLGGIQFGSYFDPDFPTTGLQRLEKMSEDSNRSLADSARKELSRARIALSTLKKMNVLSGLGPVHSFTSPAWVGVEFEGIVVYRDRGGVKARQSREGVVEYTNKQGDIVPAGTFDEGTSTAEVSSIFAAPKETDQHEVPVEAEGVVEEQTVAAADVGELSEADIPA